VKLEAPLKEKCITVTLVPFESNGFTHYNRCWGPFEISEVRDPFERKVHYS